MMKASRIKVLVSPRTDTHPYLEQLYSEVSNLGVTVYASETKVDFFRKSIKANIIHLHWIEFFLRSRNLLLTLAKAPILILALLFLKLLGKKVIITLHNIKPHEMLYPHLAHCGFKFCLGIADAVIVHNEHTKKSALAIYKITDTKVHVIQHGNFISFYPNMISKENARAILKIPKNKFVILYLGHIRPYKGLGDLISALDHIFVKEKEIVGIICGQSQDRNLEKDLLQFSAKFSGSCMVRPEYIPDDEIQIFMNAADIGVLPYKDITTSGALLLFMSFRKPAIVPDLEPIREILAEDGIYFKAGDVKSLEAAILKSQHLDLSSVAEKIYKRALTFGWDKIAEETVMVYKQVWPSKRPRQEELDKLQVNH